MLDSRMSEIRMNVHGQIGEIRYNHTKLVFLSHYKSFSRYYRHSRAKEIPKRVLDEQSWLVL